MKFSDYIGLVNKISNEYNFEQELVEVSSKKMKLVNFFNR